MLYDESFCISCNKITAHFNGKCGDCEGRKEKEAKEKYDRECASMFLEQRVKSLEEWRYKTIQDENRDNGF